MCRIEDVTNFHGSLTFDMFKMFQYSESPSHAIFLNSFYFSIFAFIKMLFCLICTLLCCKMCRIEDITNFHFPPALRSRKIAGYFKSPYYPILLNSFLFSIFAFIKVLQGCICGCISPIICWIEDITNFHGRLILNNGTLVRYFESTYHAIFLNSFYFHILSFFGML